MTPEEFGKLRSGMDVAFRGHVGRVMRWGHIASPPGCIIAFVKPLPPSFEGVEVYREGEHAVEIVFGGPADLERIPSAIWVGYMYPGGIAGEFSGRVLEGL
jgi:hypothetical protein